jgi:NAD(P)-dependent dehydrogenase (short-subunit alcohol dehydrogenase family)
MLRRRERNGQARAASALGVLDVLVNNAGIVMSSLAGRFGYPNRSPYSTTKWGLIGFTKTLSPSLSTAIRKARRDIRVNSSTAICSWI